MPPIIVQFFFRSLLNFTFILTLQINDYKEAEQSARKNRNGIWQYGDSTEDQAGEFGLSR